MKKSNNIQMNPALAIFEAMSGSKVQKEKELHECFDCEGCICEE